MSGSGSKSSRLNVARETPPAGRALLRETVHALALVLAGASVLYLVALLPSRLRTDSLRRRRDALRAEKKRLTHEVDELRAETRLLDTDSWAVERALRRRLGFLRAGEQVVKLERL